MVNLFEEVKNQISDRKKNINRNEKTDIDFPLIRTHSKLATKEETKEPEEFATEADANKEEQKTKLKKIKLTSQSQLEKTPEESEEDVIQRVQQPKKVKDLKKKMNIE